MITALGGSIPDPGEPAVSDAAGFSIQSDEPIKEVTIWENFNLYRRWTPNTKEFTVKNVKLPVGHANWFYLMATDAKGRTVVSPGMLFGKQIVHTWRCGDRQNWWDFSNIYTGCEMSQVDFRVPSNGTLEGSGLFPEPHGPQRGDNLAPILDFSLASPAAYIQDLYLDQRYYRAVMDEVMCDAKPVNPTSRSRVFEAKVRYQRFYVEKPKNDKLDFMPEHKEVNISLRKPIESDADVFPVFSHLDIKHAQVSGDMSYSYVDPSTHVEVTGTLQKGFLDLPKGGRVGGFIALSDGIRVGANHIVGFAPPAWTNGALPVGTTWHATFVTVPPTEVGPWLSLMGLRGVPPYALSVKSGKLAGIAYIAACDSANYGFEGSVDKPLDTSVLQPLVTGLVNKDKEALGAPLREYRLPMTVAGVNYNWPAALLRDGKFIEEVPVFEGKAYARLDVTKTGSFYIGNTVLCDAPKLRIGLLRWTSDGCEVELNNPTRADIEATVWTVPQVKGQFSGRTTVKVKAGSSLNAKLGPGIPPQ